MHLQRIVAVAAAVSLAGCLGSSITGGLDLPPGSASFELVPLFIQYRLTDSAMNPQGGRFDYQQTWLPQFGLSGAECLGLLPHSVGDSTGTFVLVHAGSVAGLVEERNYATYDTIVGSLLYPGFPTAGNYAVTSAGALSLTFTDGAPSHYFDPKGTVTLVGDTIVAHAEVSQQADSLHETWNLTWVRQACQ